MSAEPIYGFDPDQDAQELHELVDADVDLEYRWNGVPDHLYPGALSSSREFVPSSSPVDLVPSSHVLHGTKTNDFGPEFVPSPSSWLPLDIVALAANPPAPPEIIDLFYAGYNHLVSGESEAQKTWLLLCAVTVELELGNGVYWVDGDGVGSGALQERLRLLGADDAAISEGFAYARPDAPLDVQLESVVESVRGGRVRLAVFDGFNPLLQLHGLDPDRGVDVEKFYRLIDPIRRTGAANVITDNVVKSREARGGWAIGSERKRSKADVHLEMSSVKALVRGSGSGRAKITVRKDRHGHLTRPSPGMLVIESGAVFSWRIQPDESRDEQGAFRPTTLMLKVSQFLERHIDEPQSRNQIESGVSGRGVCPAGDRRPDRRGVRTGARRSGDDTPCPARAAVRRRGVGVTSAAHRPSERYG